MLCGMHWILMSTEMSAAGVPAVEALCIRDLQVSFTAPGGDIRAVQGVNLEVAPGECVGVVGESGAGKSQIFLAALGLLSANGRARGSVRLGTSELLGSSARELDRIRGARIAMIFQDPMTSLTPHLRIAAQIAEPLVRHGRSSWRDARRRALELLQRVQMSEPERRLQQYPHELSGGMRQRASIAIALAC